MIRIPAPLSHARRPGIKDRYLCIPRTNLIVLTAPTSSKTPGQAA